MQLDKSVRRCTKLLLILGSVPASLYIYHCIVDHMNRRLPLTEQTLLNFIAENGGLELIRKGPVKISSVECNVNQYKRHANICMLLEAPSKGFYKYQAEYVSTKGMWKLVNSSSSTLDPRQRSGSLLNWVEHLRTRFAHSTSQRES